MCLGFADCALNAKGIDQVAYDIYGPTGNNDAHSVTAYNTFFAPVNAKVIEIEDEQGNKSWFGPDQKIKVKRAGREVAITGKEFVENDEYLGWVE